MSASGPAGLLVVNWANTIFSPSNRNDSGVKYNIQKFTKTVQHFRFCHFENSFSIKSLPHGVLFLRDLIALVMSSDEKIFKFEVLLILKMVNVKVKLLIINNNSHI